MCVRKIERIEGRKGKWGTGYKVFRRYAGLRGDWTAGKIRPEGTWLNAMSFYDPNACVGGISRQDWPVGWTIFEKVGDAWKWLFSGAVYQFLSEVHKVRFKKAHHRGEIELWDQGMCHILDCVIADEMMILEEVR